MTDRPSVLYVCVHNAGRSQMAAAYTRHLSGGAVEVRSAGTGALADHAMDERSAAILTDLGGDPSGFLGRRLTPATGGSRTTSTG